MRGDPDREPPTKGVVLLPFRAPVGELAGWKRGPSAVKRSLFGLTFAGGIGSFRPRFSGPPPSGDPAA